MLLTETGFIPWKILVDGLPTVFDVSSQGVSSSSSLHGDGRGNYGRLTYDDILAVYTNRNPSDHVTKGGGWFVPRLLGPLKKKTTTTTKTTKKEIYKDSSKKLDQHNDKKGDSDKDKVSSQKQKKDMDTSSDAKKENDDDDRYPLATAYCVSFGLANPRYNK